MHTTLRTLGVLSALAALSAVDLSAQDKKKPDKKDQPRAILAIPLGAAPATTSRFMVRGQLLDTASAVKFDNAEVACKIISKGKAAVPDKNPDKVGDTEIEIEVTLPKDLPSGPLPFTVVTPKGEAKHALLIEAALPIVKEKEPNDGFRQAQPITLPAAIDGVIERPRDVDVFRFEGKAGDRVVFEVRAARHGSALDSILTLYDAKGQALATNDDQKDTVDSRLEMVLPAAGTYYITLVDAHDTDSPAHVYRLSGRLQSAK